MAAGIAEEAGEWGIRIINEFLSGICQVKMGVFGVFLPTLNSRNY
jgi:hypothetical protein